MLRKIVAEIKRLIDAVYYVLFVEAGQRYSHCDQEAAHFFKTAVDCSQ